jgi:hypothetical protein
MTEPNIHLVSCHFSEINFSFELEFWFLSKMFQNVNIRPFKGNRLRIKGQIHVGCCVSRIKDCRWDASKQNDMLPNVKFCKKQFLKKE